jgi:hypothetical protein
MTRPPSPPWPQARLVGSVRAQLDWWMGRAEGYLHTLDSGGGRPVQALQLQDLPNGQVRTAWKHPSPLTLTKSGFRRPRP